MGLSKKFTLPREYNYDSGKPSTGPSTVLWANTVLARDGKPRDVFGARSVVSKNTMTNTYRINACKPTKKPCPPTDIPNGTPSSQAYTLDIYGDEPPEKKGKCLISKVQSKLPIMASNDKAENVVVWLE